ncbi:flavodoxin domain-containing protein [Alkaliphilus transvaalensis]|uniref:flavodoxin domain-containing protein n=1 Tax=Alkaliphilus transvaalensis TaxID=114628 RepID=UPI00047A70D0|nr:flavodoxin domain-containing protein [Alkaliphilus transvaalensis]
MKTVVVYRSKTGFTKQYAEWIAQELSADLLEGNNTSLEKLLTYDVVILGGGLYGSGINGLKLITKNFQTLKEKQLIVFATGACVGRENEIAGILNKNFTLEQQQKIKFFYLRGGYNHSLVNPMDKFLMTLLKWKIKSKKTLTPDEKGLLAVYDHPVNFTRRKNIEKLITYVLQL